MARAGRIYLEIGKRIKDFRKQLGISQQVLSEKLGVSRPTISQIENGDRMIRTDELMKFSDVLNVSIEALLDLEKQPAVILENVMQEKKPKPQIRISVPQKYVEKFKEVLLYVFSKVGSKPNIGETVLYKLLYFIDFDFYEKYEQQLIGATYIKNHYGPTPIEFQKIIETMINDEEIEKVQSNYFSYPQTKYLPLRKPDLSKLKAQEIETIDEVLNRLSEMNANQISEYSHRDIPWLTTENGKVIKYESVFYRTAAYSVREYDAEF